MAPEDTRQKCFIPACADHRRSTIVMATLTANNSVSALGKTGQVVRPRTIPGDFLSEGDRRSGPTDGEQLMAGRQKLGSESRPHKARASCQDNAHARIRPRALSAELKRHSDWRR